jgi:type IX secretion system PorP/SprF family membrane protein
MTTMQKIIVSCLICLSALTSVTAQQAGHFSQYTFNKLNFNPALLGAYEALTLSGFYRHQWFGVAGAPRTGLLNVIAPLTRHNTVLGMSLSYDQIGMTQTGQAAASYTYVVRMNNGMQLMGGLNGMVEYGRVDWTLADPSNPQDGLIGDGAENVWKPNFGAGLGINTRSWYVGLSVPRFLKNHLFRGNQVDEPKAIAFNEIYLMGGVDFRLGNNVRFRPSLLISYNPSAPLDIAGDASFLMFNRLILGAAYRLEDAATAFVQYRFSPQWKMGVAYDFTLSDLNHYSNGSAEFMMEYTFDRAEDGTRHIRFF